MGHPVGIETVFYLESLRKTGWRPEPPINQETACRKLIPAPRENGGPRTPSGRIPRTRLWRRCVSLPRKRKTRKPAASKPGSGGTRVQQIPPSSLRPDVGMTRVGGWPILYFSRPHSRSGYPIPSRFWKEPALSEVEGVDSATASRAPSALLLQQIPQPIQPLLPSRPSILNPLFHHRKTSSLNAASPHPP